MSEHFSSLIGAHPLDGLPADVTQFVCETSLLDTLTAEAADAVRGADDSAAYLAELARLQFPIPYPAELRAAAQTWLAQRDAAHFNALIYRIAELSEAAGDLLQAAARYVQIDRVDRLVALIEREGDRLFASGRAAMLHDLLAFVPESCQSPLLWLLRSNLAIQTGAWAQAQAFAEAGLQLPVDREQQASLRLQLARAQIFQDVFDAALETCRQILAEPHSAAIRARALRTLSLASKRHNSDSIRTVAYLHEALTLALAAGDQYQCCLIHNDLQVEYNAAGDRDLAITHLEQADEILRKLGNLPERTLVLNNLGVLFHEQGAIERALQTLTQAATLARTIDNQRYLALAMFSLGDIFCDQQRWDEAYLAYEHTNDLLAYCSPDIRRLFRIAVAQLERRCGRLQAAAAQLAHSDADGDSQSLVVRGIIHALNDEFVQAQACFAGAAPALIQDQCWRELAQSQLFSAYVAHRQQAPVATVAAALRSAARIVHSHFGHDLVLHADLPPLREALRYAAAAEPQAAAWLLLLGEQVPAAAESSPEPAAATVQYTTPAAVNRRTVEPSAASWRASSAIAHDLQNLLLIISGNAELLHLELTDPGAQEKLQVMINAVDDAGKVLRRFQQSGLLNTDKVMQPVRVRSLVATVISYLRSGGWLGADVAVVQTIPVDYVVAGKTEDLRRVLFNLAKNALEAMAGQGVLTVTAAAVQDSEERTLIRLTISDTGPGIPPAVLRGLRSGSLTTKASGTGFGLTIARSIVEHHGGALQIESEPGQGTAISLLLPSFVEF